MVAILCRPECVNDINLQACMVENDHGIVSQ